MNLRNKIYKKVLIFVLVLQLLFNPTFVGVVLAEEMPLADPTPTVEVVQPTVTPQDTPSPSPVPSDPTPTPTVEATPTPGATTQTGDAESSSQTENQVNTNQDQVNSPTPTETQIQNDNTADVSSGADSASTTGNNQISGSGGEAAITTGDASATGEIDNIINTNIVTVEATPSADLTVTPTPTGEAVLTVSNDNQATVTSEAVVTASTGQNEASGNGGNTTITTGDAQALANLLNLVNTNIVGSNLTVMVLDANGQIQGDIDLNALWQQILAQQAQGLNLVGETQPSSLTVVVQTQNEAKVENNIQVTAQTGGNQAENNGGDTNITTGDAQAAANVNNIVNTNIVGSKFFLGVVNILVCNGDLVLPRPEMFNQDSTQGANSSAVILTSNQAQVENTVQASADTGQNEQTGSAGTNSLTTGNAQALASSFSLVNLTMIGNNWFFLVINNLGNWQGNVNGWSAPQAQESPTLGTQVYQLGLTTESASEPQAEIDSHLPLVSLSTQNEATVENNVQVTAQTGGNQAENNQGSSNIQTGNAWAVANLFNLINTNLVGGHFFAGIVNVMGNWTGNVVFAYPDVTVSLSSLAAEVSPGETFDYTLNFQNQGKDKAQGVQLEFDFPDGVSYVGDSSGVTPSCSTKSCLWSLGNLEANQAGNFNIKVKLSPDFSPEKITFWQKIIPQAYAAENQATFIVNAAISTVDPESDTQNNSAWAQTLVDQPQASQIGEQDPRHPILEISAWNNVNTFVYPGDTVSFEITVKNTGDVPSYNTSLIQRLYNGAPEDFGTMSFNLGTIEPGKSGKLTFGLKLSDDTREIPLDSYRTVAQAFGNAPNGDEISSNESRTYFEIRLKEAMNSLVAQAQAQEEQVLGTENNVANCPPAKEDILPYILLFLLSSAYLVGWAKKKLNKKTK